MAKWFAYTIAVTCDLNSVHSKRLQAIFQINMKLLNSPPSLLLEGKQIFRKMVTEGNG